MTRAGQRSFITLGLASVFAAVLASGTAPGTMAVAQEASCYMVTSSGRRVSLGSLCANAGTGRAVSGVHLAQIKRRTGGTPVIEVTFNGQQRFEMLLDTGASGTVITRDMAESLQVPVIGRQRFILADGRSVVLPIGVIESMAVDGAEVRNVKVAIADNREGLLGQDFYGNFDIKIKQNVVEFYRR